MQSTAGSGQNQAFHLGTNLRPESPDDCRRAQVDDGPVPGVGAGQRGGAAPAERAVEAELAAVVAGLATGNDDGLYKKREVLIATTI